MLCRFKKFSAPKQQRLLLLDLIFVNFYGAGFLGFDFCASLSLRKISDASNTFSEYASLLQRFMFRCPPQ
jgi:hypothetical protein